MNAQVKAIKDLEEITKQKLEALLSVEVPELSSNFIK
jgi:hypothetical protein